MDVMTISFPGNKKVDSTYRGFTVHTDQPKEDGGDHSAPEPFDLFLASIGTCAGIYVASFCQERKIDMAGLKLELTFDKNDKTFMVEKIRIHIHLPAGFPEKYRNAVARTADLCFVKKHLLQPPQFEIAATIASV